MSTETVTETVKVNLSNNGTEIKGEFKLDDTVKCDVDTFFFEYRVKEDDLEKIVGISDDDKQKLRDFIDSVKVKSTIQDKKLDGRFILGKTVTYDKGNKKFKFNYNDKEILFDEDEIKNAANQNISFSYINISVNDIYRLLNMNTVFIRSTDGNTLFGTFTLGETVTYNNETKKFDFKTQNDSKAPKKGLLNYLLNAQKSNPVPEIKSFPEGEIKDKNKFVINPDNFRKLMRLKPQMGGKSRKSLKNKRKGGRKSKSQKRRKTH